MDQLLVTNTLSLPNRPLLRTKLCIPRTRNEAIPRPRLLEQLNAHDLNGHLQPQLTLITAPAGYGKSTLVTQWLNQLEQPYAWLSLDSNDNDPARFLAYLFAALATMHTEIGDVALARLTSTYIYNDAEAMVTAALNQISLSDEQMLLVLDDYHAITAPAVHSIVDFLLQHKPPQLHLVITSRAEPPLAIALLRGRGELTHLTAADLCFNHEEAAAFMQTIMGLTFNHQEIIQLDYQVEGWVTGLQLVGLALHKHVELQSAFSGNQRYLVDYLAEQVLARQTPEIQAFLLHTAILEQFCGPLCDAVLGAEYNHSQTLLTQLESANLFLIPLDIERQWYRYHHLFADFLRGRLTQQMTASQIRELHCRAADWYFANNQALAAIEHALTAQNFVGAAQMITAVARQVLMFGEGRTLRQWVELLPADHLTADTQLTLHYIWALIRTGDFGRAHELLEQTSDQLDNAKLWGEWAALRARLAVMSGETEVNIRFSQKALAKLPSDHHNLRSEVAINLGFSHLQLANLHAAREAFAEAAQHTAHDPGLWSVMFATFYWAETFIRQGDLQQAFAIFQRGLEIGQAQTLNGRPSPAIGFMHVGLGQIFYEWNRLDEAEPHLRQALHLAEQCGDHKLLIYARSALAQLLTTCGDWSAAQSILTELEGQTGEPTPSRLRAELALQQGELGIAESWVVRHGLTLTAALPAVQEQPYDYLILLKVMFAKSQFAGVLSALHTLEALAVERHNTHFLLQTLLLQALAHAKQGALEPAINLIQRLLSLAEAGSFVRLFLDYRDPALGRLLHHAAQGGLAADYAHRVLRQMAPIEETAAEFTLEPLSPRELEVLQYLAAGLTNHDIAQELVVTLNTVKAHNRRLFRKLEVTSRTQAVARGRELNLL